MLRAMWVFGSGADFRDIFCEIFLGGQFLGDNTMFLCVVVCQPSLSALRYDLRIRLRLTLEQSAT